MSAPRPPDERPLEPEDERPLRPGESEARTRVMERRGPPGPPPPRRTGWPPPGGVWPWLLALLIIVLGGLAAAYFLTRNDDEGTVAVPALVGLDQAGAVRKAGQVGLPTNVRNVPSNEDVGVVVAQMPGAGTDVDRGTLVVINVSSGPRQVEVPNVLGLDEATAGARLAQAGLQVRVVRVPSTQAAGKVVAQNPRSGEEVAAGSSVRINVSQGPSTTTTVVTTATGTTTTTEGATVAVPDVVGETAAEAADDLAAAGLVPRPVQVSSSQPGGTVVAQNPRAGARVSRGSSVRINVAQGP